MSAIMIERVENMDVIRAEDNSGCSCRGGGGSGKAVEKRSLGITSTYQAIREIPDLKRDGNPNLYRMLGKASSEKQGFMRTTKAFEIEGCGVFVLCCTNQAGGNGGRAVSETSEYIPGVKLIEDTEHISGHDKGYKVVRMCWLERIIGEITATVRYFRGR